MNEAILQKLSAVTPEEQKILNGETSIDRELYMDGSEDVIDAARLLKRGRLLTIRPHTRFIAFPEHTHNYVEIVYMCQGTTTHTVNGTKICLHPGELLMMAQGVRQAIEPAGEQDIAVNFIVRPEFFRGTLPYLGEEKTPLRSFILDCLSEGKRAGYLYFQVADILPVQNLLENLVWTTLNPPLNRREVQQMTMGLLFTNLMSYTERLRLESSEEETIVSILRYMEEHYRDGSLTELADSLHYDLSVLSRLVKEKTGKTYTELLQEKRLGQACWMLEHSDVRVEDIGRAVGYENLSYFHRVFRETRGCSPKKYRDKMRSRSTI